ncbi:plant UBX domain-containing protein 11 [Magnolia sinica]|uniref:plant UBX domain-containing protein 11 n=1 Tax=Magnolia sinica TaxID=86752 RepID=UPI00265A76F0|nr:plant UBX domain-containing protein 11 [Magnolia sinica]XP_058094049.1 plant UBX domain-containing protein 11 [Magnolia sinica]XP_058094050.1 plant UBX domain-containing protein 11 [Magnolia sinica]XP_058094051.1 plant UBX domain-containing protein 11 [Magnolia sinica]XP_058094052.1 plant UBX domain-containing protein 11 [Magnolia sinica]
MESSTSSLTFKGSIPEAIIEAQKKRKLFVVYISGEDENSVLLEQTTWVDLNVAESISRHCVFLHLVHGSVDASRFSAIYPQKSVPSISAIGYNGGKLLWQHEGYVNAEKLVADIQKACTSLHLQETTATVLTAAALASKNPEPQRFNATSIASFEQGSSSTTNIPTSSTEDPPQGSETKPLITSEIIGENLTSDPIAEKYSKLDEETTSQPTHVNEWECGNDGRSISTSKTSKSSFSPATIDVAESDIETRPLNVGNGSVAPPDGITLNDHNTRNSMGSSGEMPTNHGPEFSQERPQVSVNEVEDSSLEKPDGSASHGNVTRLNEVHLNIRLPAGSSLQVKFSITDTLRMVKNYVDENQTDGIGAYDLAIPYPRKVFNEQDMSKALSELGFFNREALIVVPHRPVSGSYRGQSSSHENSSSVSDTDTSADNGGGYFGYVRGILSYMNPFSYFGGSANPSNSEPTPNDDLWQYRPNPTHRSASSGAERSHRPYPPGTTPGENVSNARKTTTTGFGGNIHTLKHDEDDGPSSDRNTFWNGNSTQYGGGDSK